MASCVESGDDSFVCPGGRVPKARGAIVGSRRDLRAGVAEVHGDDVAGVAGVAANEIPRVEIPQVGLVVVAAREQPDPAEAEGERVDSAFVLKRS
jgi:hypothetical protein